MMLHSKYQGSRPCSFRQEYFISKIYFSRCDLDMEQTGTICIIIKEGHIRIISAKFGENPVTSLGDDVL